MESSELQKKSKLLVVDDIPSNIKVLVSYLEKDYQLITAESGKEALELVEKENPDLILLDVMMPELDGFETCRIIKSKDEHFYIPVILVTALDDIEDKITGIESGADDFITKPVNKHEVKARVKSLLRIKLLHDQLQDKVNQLEVAQETLQELATTDGLTNLYNYRFFKDTLTKEIERVKRNQSCFSLILFDIDDFKKYNDTYGHLAGDEILKCIADLLRKNVRSNDVAARYGGEEFALILPDTNRDSAMTVASKIKTLIDNDMFGNHRVNSPVRITISVGVSTFPKDGTTLEEIIDCADRRLYIAKDRGKNLVIDEG